MYQTSAPQPTRSPVCAQTDLLMRRLQELERVLGVQEWWLLGRELSEARVLAEVTSLLAVARAELNQVLVQFCGHAPAAGTAEDEAPEPSGDASQAPLEQQRESAVEIIQTLTAALPPTLNFARQLRPFAERAGMPTAGVDTLGIVADRLADAQEALGSVAH